MRLDPRPRVVVRLLPVLVCAGLWVGASAQNITGEIDGTIRDASGAVVVGATVNVTNTDTKQLVRTLSTNKNGEYSATLLQVGTYKVEIAASGFAPEQLTNIPLNVGDTLTEDAQLKPFGAATEVTVSADEQVHPNLQTTENSTIISNEEIKELALNTRNFQQMLLLQPGVSYGGPDNLNTGQVDPTGQKSSHNLSINGLQPFQVAFLLDGADILNHTTSLNTIVFPNVESINQTQTLRNSYGAQYSGGGSAQVSIVTKSGGAAYHGDLFLFFRNKALNATPFADLITNPIQPKPTNTQYDGGFTLGGPLFIPHLYPKDRSKTFFFFAQEIRRLDNAYQDILANYPTLAQAHGYLQDPVCVHYAPATGVCDTRAALVGNSPYPGFNFQVPAQYLNPTAQAYLKDIIIPALSAAPPPDDPLNATNFSYQVPSNTSETQELVRLDHQFSERFNAFFRFIYDPLHQVLPNGYNSGGAGYIGVGNSVVDNFGEDFLGHVTWTVRANTVVEAGVSYAPYQIKNVPTGSILAANSPDVQFNLPYANTTGRLPAVNIIGTAFSSSGPGQDLSHTLQFFENTTHVIGKHVLYFGGNIEKYDERVNQGTNNAGIFTFNEATVFNAATVNGVVYNTGQLESAFTDFLIGYPKTFTQASIDPVADPSAHVYEAYLQDNWRATARLTLNGGVRYSIFGAPSDALGHAGGFQPEAFDAKAAPPIGTDGTLCIPPPSGTTIPAACGALPLNPAYNPLNGIVQAGKNSVYGAAIVRTPLLNFAPRVGFAWNVYGDGKTSLRGGYGIYYNQIPLFTYAQDTFGNPGYISNPQYSVQPISFTSPAGNVPIFNAAQAIAGLNRNFRQPYTQSFSLDLQQQIGRSTLIDIAYVGNQTQHLQGEEDLNQPRAGAFLNTNISVTPIKADGTGTLCTQPITNTNQGVIPGTNHCEIIAGTFTNQLNQIRPYPGYGPINFVSTRFFSDYNSLQASINQRFNKSIVLGVNYTWSKAMANSPGPSRYGAQFDPQDRTNLAAEWGPTPLNRKHIFNAHFVITAPSHSALHGVVGATLNGWEVSGIVAAQSGTNYTVKEAVDDPAGLGGLASGSSAQLRADVNFNPNFGPKTRQKFFDTTAYSYVPRAQVRPGNGHIGSLVGPGYQNWNLSLFKNFEIGEHSRLQLRGEAFNAFNHVNYNQMGIVLNNGNFGQVTSYYENRILQVGGRYTF